MKFATLFMLAAALLSVLSVPSAALGSSLNATAIHVGRVPVQAIPAMSEAKTNPKGGSATTSGAKPRASATESMSENHLQHDKSIPEPDDSAEAMPTDFVWELELQLVRSETKYFKEVKADLPPTNYTHSLVDEILLLLQQQEETIEKILAVNEEILAINEEIRARHSLMHDALPEELPLSKQEDSLEAPGSTDVSKDNDTTESTTETIEPATADPQDWVEHLLNRIGSGGYDSESDLQGLQILVEATKTTKDRLPPTHEAHSLLDEFLRDFSQLEGRLIERLKAPR